MIYLEQKILEEVMVFLRHHYRFVSYLLSKRKFAELKVIKKVISEGLKSGHLTFHHEDKSLDINLELIEKQKGKAWTNVLRKQLKLLSEIS